jgi:tRNA-uridine 2-sulfurtransferase
MSIARPKVVVAMSGGVDSSVAACLLHEQGYDVTGLFMRMGVEAPEEPCPSAPGTPCKPLGPAQFRDNQAAQQSIPGPQPSDDRHRGCCSALDASDARAVAGRLGIPFFALNFKEQFDSIIDHFSDEYLAGRTPNPCVMCNQQLKFGRLVSYADAMGAEFIATGHYARIERGGTGPRLCRGVDRRKDQSYVLFGIGRQMLARTLFPIGGMTKDVVREHARRLGLPVSEKPDSVDICFVPDRDYARVVRERRPEALREGPILDVAGHEIGRHNGIVNFTIGQRRGLGVAVGQPVYVTHIDAETNAVTLGPRDGLARSILDASRMCWLVDRPAAAFRAAVQIRYTHPGAAATVEPIGDDAVHVTFDEPQFATTPGQAAVIYDGDTVLGGGWIT